MSVLFPDDIEANIASIKNSKLDTSLLSQREQNILDAKLEKVKFLDKARAIEKRNQLESAAGRMGFDPDGIIGGAVDESVAAANFVTKVVAGTAAIVPNLHGWAADASSDEGSQLAAMMENRGYASKEDTALLDKRTNLFGQEEGVIPALDSLGVYSNRERQEYSQFNRDLSAKITEKGQFDDLVTTDVATGKTYSGAAARIIGDTSVSLLKGAVGVPEMAVGLANIVSGGQAGKSLEEMGVRFKDTKQILDTFLTHEQQMANSKVLNSEGFLNTLESIIDNPSTALQFLAESLPAMLAGGVIGKGIYGGSALVGKLLSNAGTSSKVMTALAAHGSRISAGLGEGTVMAGAMAENLRQQSKDGLLDGKGVALSLAMLPMGAAVSIGGGALASKVGLGDIDRALVEGKLPKLKGSRIINTVGSAAIEAGEEGLQTAGETIAENIAMNRPWDKGLGNAVAIGMATGATLGGPAGLARASKNKGDLKEQQRKAIQEAVSTGVVSAFTDPESPSYNPEQAVSILQAHSNTEGTAPEVKAANKTKVEELLASISREAEGVSELIDLNSPENRVAFKTAIETNKQELEDNRATMSAEEIAAKESIIATIEKTLLSSKELKVLTTQDKKNKERIESITQMYESWDSSDNAEGTAVGDLVKAATTEVAVDDTDGITASTDAAKEVINLAMRSPEQLSTGTLESLINSPSAQFTDDHKALFSSILNSRAASRIAKSSSAVSAEFFDGGDGNVGINQYADSIRTANADGDTNTAAAESAKLKSFVEGHVKKAKMMERLLAEFKKTGKQGQMVPVGAKNSGEWAEPAKPMTEAELDAVGGLYIDTRTAKVVKAVRAEANAGLLLYKELNTAGSLNTNGTVATAVEAESITALVDAASTEQGKASVKSLTSGTRVDAAAYAALKKELTPAQMKEVNTLYGKNKKPVTKKGKGNEASQAEKKYKTEQAKQVASAKAAVNKKSKKNKANFAMSDATIENKIESTKRAIKDPAKKDFKETNELVLAVYEEALASRKAPVTTAVTEEVVATTESQQESEITKGLENNAPKEGSPSFLVPIEAAVDSVEEVAKLVAELDSVEQSIKNTTDEDTLIELEEKREDLLDAISEKVDEIIDQLIDQLGNMPSQVAEGIRDELHDLKESEEDSDIRLRNLSNILIMARNISNSTEDMFGDTPSVSTTQTQEPEAATTSTEEVASEFKASTDENPLVREARDAVRKALIAMNFKFTDQPNAPDVMDIERIASKILSGLYNDDPAFIKDAAKALSYALFAELGATERSSATREWIEQSLTHWLMTGEAPTKEGKPGMWVKVMEVYKRLISFFQSEEYEKIHVRLEKMINDIRTGEKDFSFKPKEGFSKLDFQTEMDNNPDAVKVLLALSEAGVNFTLTGSVAYSDQVPVYRKKGQPLHDIDLLMSESDIENSQKLLQQAGFGTGVVLYSFKPNGRTVVGLAVVPAGYEIRNKVSGWRAISNAVHRSYDVFEIATNKKVGSYSFEAKSHETFEGIAGVTVDLMSSGDIKTSPQEFTANGERHTLQVARYEHGFSKKLEMLRYKDIHDFLAVVPPTPSENKGEVNTSEESAPENTINIWHGSNETAELSNIAERPFQYKGVNYFSVEHAYQSLKSGAFDQTTYDKYKAGNQKIAGRKGTKTDGNWNLSLMEDLVLESFKQNPDAKKALLDTGNSKFSHTQDKGVWKTEFPRILESVRKTLKENPDVTTSVTATTSTEESETLSNGKKVSELSPKEVIDSLLKSLDRVRNIHMSVAEGNNRALEDMDEARSDVTKLLDVVEGIDENVKEFYLQILNSDKPLSLEETSKWLMKYSSPVRSTLVTKISALLKGKNFNGFTFITSEVDMPTGGKAIPAGLYDTNENIIGINPLSTVGAAHPTKQRIMVTMTHELIHAALDELIRTNPELRAGIKVLQEKVGKFLNSKESKSLTKWQRSNLEYSISNEYEYFSTIVSDPEMMKVIDSIKTGSGKSIVTELVLLVVNALRKSMHLTVPEATLLTDTLVLFSQAIGDAPINAPPSSSKVFGFKLSKHNNFTPKDQLKADKASAFIGVGAEGTATDKYSKDAATAGIPVNTTEYTSDDVVFVSANGSRKDRVKMNKDNPLAKPVFAALDAAIAAGATIITDEKGHRDRKFNVGEREVAAYLAEKGYVDTDGVGTWVAANNSTEVETTTEGTTAVYTDDLQQLIDEAFERNEDDYYLGDSDSFTDSAPAWFDDEGIPTVDESGEVVIAQTAEELEAIKEANHKELLDMFEEDVALAEAQLAEAEATRLGTNVVVDEMDPEDAEQRHESKYLKSTEGKLEFDMTEREGAISAYQGKNLIGHYFMQVASKVGGLAPRPLVAVKDFMQGIIDGTYKYQDFLEDTVTDDQQYLLNMYTEFHTKVRDEVLRLLVQKKDVNADYDYMNPIRYFMKEVDGVYVLDENVVSAFTSTMFSWIGDEGANSEMDTNETIHAKMGLTLDENVTTALGNLVRTAGLRRTLAMNALGRNFMQSLGFKAVNDEIPVSLQPQVEGGMGAYMLTVLESLGYTEETPILTRQIIAARGMDVGAYFAANPGMDMDKHTEVFVKVRRPAAITSESIGTAPVYEVGSIVEAFKGTHGVMDKLMGVEDVGVDPTFRPVDFNAEDVTEDNQKVPKVITGILDAVGKIKHRINIQAMKVINGIGGMSTEAFETMVGIEEVNESNTHIARRKSLQAKYDGKRREIEHFQNFLKHLNTKSNKWTTPFYLAASYWKNGRAGYISRIDGQASKIHRWLVSTGMANTVVSMDDMDNFKLRVLEALDIKTDETPDATSLMAFDIVTGHPTIKAGVAVIQKMIFDGYVATVADQNTIVAAVLKTGTDLHGFSGLMALANMQQAKDKGQSDFSTTLTAEIDGKTNGPMLSMWLLGVMDADLAEMGGFYSEGTDHKSFSHWKIKGGYDLYQSTAIGVNRNIKFLLTEDPSKQSYFDSLFRITGKYEDEKGVTKNGRQVVKDAINPLTYGSSIGRAIESMADAYIESIYKRMEDITKGKSYSSDTDGNPLYGEQAYAALKNDINHLIGYKNSKFAELYNAKTLAEAMETALNKEQENSLRAVYGATVGKAVNSTLKADFKDYLKSRKMIIDASNLSFGMYNAAFKAAYENVLNDMMDSGDIPSRVFKGVREPIHGLTKKQVKEVQARIKKLEPRFNTSISLKDDSEDSLDRGIFSGNNDKTLSNRHAYSTETRVNGGSALVGKPFVKLKGKSSHGYELVLTNPGASIMSMLVQNTDASIMLPQIPKFEGLGVHDALIVPLGKSAEAGKSLNEATINQLLDYSLARESLQALERSFIAMAEQIKENPDNTNLQKEFDEMLGDMLDNMDDKTRGLFGDASEFFGFTLNRMAVEASRADYERLTGLSKLTVVDQYTIEAGVYQVPQEFRDEAKKRISSISKTASKEALEAVKILTKYAGGNPEAAVTAPVTKAVPERTTTTHSANESVSTAIGSPNFKADAELEAQLAAGKLDTGAKLVKYLTTKATLSKTDTGKFYSLLLGRIGKLIIKDMKIVYLTKDSKLDIPDGFEEAFGWFNMTDGVPTIYIKSSDFKNSAVSMELAIHELLHAAVAQIIANPTKEVKPVIAELQSMMEATKEHLKDDLASSIRFADALSDVQEFVTWGMTNSDFQKILINQKYESRLANKNPLANMAQVFIDAISRLIFGSSNQSNQMSVLYAHVYTLMDASDLKKSGLDISLKANNTVPELEASTLDVFDSLATEAGAVTDPVFKEHLRNLLTNIVDKLHGPYGVIFEAAKANMAVTPLDVWAKAKDTGMLPFRSSLSAAGFNLGEQESFVAEMIQVTMIETFQNNTQPVEKALMKLVQEAREAIKVGDLDNDPIVDAAKRKILFEAPEGDVTGHWRANIIALSLVSKPIADLMMFNTAENTDKPTNTLYGRILNWFNKLLNRINSGMGKAYGGQKAMDKMEVIANRLVDIQAKRVLEQSRKNSPTYAEHAETYLNGVGEKAREMLIKVGKSNILQNKTGNVGIILGNTLSLSMSKQVGKGMEVIEDYYMEHTDGQLSFIAKLYEEIRGSTNNNEWGRVTLMLTKYNEKIRQDLSLHTSQSVMESYVNGGKDLDVATRTAITKVLLRTGSFVLLEDIGMQRLEEVLRDPVELEKEIQNQINKLSGKNADYYRNQSLLLGYYLATGYVKEDNLRMNAHSIARLDGTKADTSLLTEQQVAIDTKIIDSLSSLYALKYTGPANNTLIANLMESEGKRGENYNGVEYTLRVHAALTQQSKERIFVGSELLMAKGYIPEIVNPKTELHYDSLLKREELEEQGYKYVGPVQKDANDVANKNLHMYTLERGLVHRISGTFSTKSTAAAGTAVHNGLVHKGTGDEHIRNKRVHDAITKRKEANIAKLFKPRPDLDPSTDIKQYLAPSSDTNGNTVNYRYIMGNDTRDLLLERNNDFSTLLGTLASSTFDKHTTTKHNKNVVQALKEQWDKQRVTNPSHYMLVSEKSTDPEVAAAYRMLPWETRQEIKRVFGTDGMHVRRDMYDLHFGYRKFSIADMFGKKSDDRNKLEKYLVKFFTWLPWMGPQAALKLRTLEDVFQYIVREIKDILVVKTGVTLFWNVISNASLLMTYGVGPIDLIKYHAQAYVGITKWTKDTAKLNKLELERASGMIIGSSSELDQKITELKEQLARNPVRGLVEAGMQPTIVEDVNMVEDLYSYKSQTMKDIEKYTDKIPSGIKTAAKWVYMSHDTPLYKLLAHGTQVSDFLAKYTLYMKTTQRANNKLSHADAVKLATAAFVNYDLPSHKGLQYMNDMGLVMFTKYYMRIQHAMLHMYQENPARGIGLLLFDSYFSAAQTIADSSFYNNMNSPFTIGPLNYFGAFNDGMVMQGIGKLFR